MIHSGVRHHIDWQPVAGTVVWTPAEHRRPTMSEADAIRLLRCTPESFARLRDLGLQAGETPEGSAYDPTDIENAALYSRSGRTVVEASFGAVLSFLREPHEQLYGPRIWKYQLSVDGTEPCMVHLPVPEAFGGRTAAGPAGAEREHGRFPVHPGNPVRGTLVSRGRADRLRSAAITAIMTDLTGSGLRWQVLSPGLKQAPQAAISLRIGDCDTFSTVLCDRLIAEGFPARAYRGWIAGITTVRHSWVEVPDEDGRPVVLDPALALLSRHTGLGSADFAERTIGTALNRVIPTRCELSEPLARTGPGTPQQVHFHCRKGIERDVVRAGA